MFDAYDSRRALDDWELEDYVLVATIEGSLYALDRKTGATRWKLDGNEPAVRSGNSGGDAEVGNNTEGNWAGGEQQPRWIVQPVEGGQLFLFDPEYGVLVISSPKMVLTEQELPLTIKQLIDHGAFKIPGCPDSQPLCTNPSDIGRFGNASVDSLEGPGYVDLDTALSRDFSLWEKVRMQVRISAQNVLNHENFSTPSNVDINSPTAGNITSSYSESAVSTARQVNFWVRFSF